MIEKSMPIWVFLTTRQRWSYNKKKTADERIDFTIVE